MSYLHKKKQYSLFTMQMEQNFIMRYNDAMEFCVFFVEEEMV